MSLTGLTNSNAGSVSMNAACRTDVRHSAMLYENREYRARLRLLSARIDRHSKELRLEVEWLRLVVGIDLSSPSVKRSVILCFSEASASLIGLGRNHLLSVNN
jgi:hypothetical protein